jgi:hypothetical protein
VPWANWLGEIQIGTTQGAYFGDAMANELTINASIEYADAEGVSGSLDVSGLQVTLTSKKWHFIRQSIATSDTAINLGGISSLGWMMLKNLDPVNYVEIKTAISGTVIGKMFPGETYGPKRVGSGITAPAAIANTAAVDVAVAISSS